MERYLTSCLRPPCENKEAWRLSGSACLPFGPWWLLEQSNSLLRVVGAGIWRGSEHASRGCAGVVDVPSP